MEEHLNQHPAPHKLPEINQARGRHRRSKVAWDTRDPVNKTGQKNENPKGWPGVVKHCRESTQEAEAGGLGVLG